MKRKVSIIIPVYNSEQYLSECLESVLKQTYSNLEIILVDNGSTDKSFSICKKYEMENSNVLSTFCGEQGAASARNEGIKISSGDYIMFVDSDDYLEDTYCEELVSGIENAQTDICVCGIRKIMENGETCDYLCPEFIINSLHEFQNMMLYLYDNFLLNSLFNKIYIKERIRFLFDNEFQIGEDLLFNLKYLSDKNLSISGISRILYNYRIFNELSDEKIKYYSKNRLTSTTKLFKEMVSIEKIGNFNHDFNKRIKQIYTNKIIFCFREWMDPRCEGDFVRKQVDIAVNDIIVQDILSSNVIGTVKKIFVYLIKEKKTKLLMFLIFAGRLFLKGKRL